MKSGLTLVQMAAEIERQSASKRDFIADTSKVSVFQDALVPTTLAVRLDSSKGPVRMAINDHAHGQFAELLKVPATFYHRLRADHPDMLAYTLTELLHREPTRRMLRTLDNRVRAVLSDKYRPLDNFDLANAVMPVLREYDGLRIESTQLTDTRFYIKAVFPKISTSIANVGDVVQAGIVISNSEVGSGALQVAPLVFRLSCKNGMIMQDYGQRRTHVGKRASGETEEAYEMFSDRTKELDDTALWAKVQDTVRGVMKQDVFEKITNPMREAAGQKIEGKIEDVVELAATRFSYNESTKEGVLRHLIEGGDLSRWGLANAITRQSQDEENYDMATKLETDGGLLVELASKDWQSLLTKPVKRAA
jgi:hypothetical protein